MMSCDALDMTLTAKKLKEAESHLSSTDKVMRGLIGRLKPFKVIKKQSAHLFKVLVTSIISQQLSLKAASAIEGRVVNLIGEKYSPCIFVNIPKKIFYKAGLSKAKTDYVVSLAEDILNRNLDLSDLAHQKNEVVISNLIKRRGIGPWTAEMFLIFGLNRSDIFSNGDAGLSRAIKMLYPKHIENKLMLDEIIQKWKPYRTVASWYLWQHLDNIKTNQ